ncbi:MAG: sugar ABC transporter substrate-binding protein [Chloroflexota bacterium]|nr:MAG: sugar ABC transporter substrate-binding protein [Chloroflexota bacterium]
MSQLASRSISRRSFVTGLGLSVAAAFLAACGGAAPPPTPAPAKPAEAPKPATAPPAAAPKPASKETQFTYTARIGVQADHFDAFAKTFMEKYPHIKYVPQHVPSAEWGQKIQVQAAGGTLADAIWMPSIGLFGQFAHKNLLMDHGPLVKSNNTDLKVFYPAAVEGLTREGKLWGIPWIVHPSRIGLYYNKPLFDEAGVKYPTDKWTWQDLTDAAQKLTKRSGTRTDQFGYQLSPDMWSIIIPIRAYGADYLTPDGKKSTLDTPEAIKAVQEGVADLVNKHKVSPTPDQIEGGSPQMFASKKLAMFQSGYWGASGLYQFAKDIPWSVAPMPIQPNGKRGMFEIDCNSVTKGAKDPDAAFLYCVHMASKEAGIDIAKRGSVPGGRPDVWESAELSEKEHHVIFTKALATTPGLLVPANNRDTEYSDAFRKGLDEVTFGKEGDASKVIKALQPQLQAILDKPAD